MEIRALGRFDHNKDQKITKAELHQALGASAQDHHLDAQEMRKLGLNPRDGAQINKALKDSAKGSAEATVFLLDDQQAVRVQSIGGAIFNKTESSQQSEYKGITADVTLPQASFDPQRYFAGQAKTPTYKIGPLDRPSVYMGGVVDLGNGKSRIMDVGLCWDRVYSPEGLETFTDQAPKGQQHGCDGNDPAHRFCVDQQAKTYQLKGQTFYVLRAKETPDSYSPNRALIVDAQGKVYQGAEAKALQASFDKLKPVTGPVILNGDYKCVASGKAASAKLSQLKPNFAFRPYWRTTHQGDNKWHNPPLGSENLYFYPGEKLKLTVKEQGKGKDNVTLRIERQAGASFETRFSQDGFGEGKPQAFKYVHSLDQFKEVNGQRLSTEGGDKIATASSLKGVSWKPFLIGQDGKHLKMDQSNSIQVGAADTSSSLEQRHQIFTSDAQGQHIQPTKPANSKP